MDRTRAYEYVHYFKMVDRRGLTILKMFSTAKCKVTAANNTLPVFKDGFTYCTPNFRNWIRAVQKIWLSRTMQVSYLTLSKVIPVNAMPNRDFFQERNGSPTKV